MNEKEENLPDEIGFSMAMNTEAIKNFSDMTKEEQKKVVAESKMMNNTTDMDQLIDRIASNNFQG